MVLTILSSSLVISVAIGLGAFGFKTHRKEIQKKRTAGLFRAQEANENVAKDMEGIEREKKIKLKLNDVKSIESKTLSDTEQSIGMDDSISLSTDGEVSSTEKDQT